MWKKKEIKEGKGVQKFIVADVILETILDGVVVVDAEGNIVKVNSAFVKMHGFNKPEEMVGMNIAQTTPEREIPKLMDSFKKHFETGAAVNFEFTIKDRNGKEFPALVNARALKDEKGKPIGTVATLRDITDLKRTEDELKKKAEELATMNEELESTNEELRQTNEELESTTEELRAANEEAQKAKEAAEKKASELERFNKVAVDRELKMKELKERIAALEQKLKEKS